METFYFILLLLGAVCFVLKVAGSTAIKYDLLALGLLFWILVPLIQTARVM